ncbi:transketolase [Candidatus Cytomitobacter indipagum]|uniref:transketolase n=1 Tax=Candidatus Cytomitobacter indipagum TaxID=2601575 RepID=A0A5C0UE30_9PROT|nr:transketolase [Candidatus Cytomitobacter indipagum]QEK38288.1 transketolase [Candidatus Cytomitobacter indipagum]
MICDKRRAANFLRCVALDMIDIANSGHQGIVLGMADVMTVLWSDHLNFQKQHSNRDRFVLSAGHGSALLYSTLYCMEEIDRKDLYTFRKIHSNLPGHPEKDDLVEVSTGPLGQGIAWAIGMAKAEQLKNMDYFTYVLASDGDLMEGISHEACSLAGKWKLNKLIVFWDDNEITIDGSTELSRSDQIPMTFKSYNWNVIEIDGHNIGEIDLAILSAKKSDKPTLIRCKTIIGRGSKYEKSEKIHGKILDKEDINEMKRNYCMEYTDFMTPPDIKCFWNNVIERNNGYFTNKNDENNVKANNRSEKNANFENDIKNNINTTNEKMKNEKYYKVSESISHLLEKDISTREASGIVLKNLSERHNDIVFGSADLGISTNTMIDENYISFGVREHGMTAITGGITLSGLKGCCATFFVFTDYARPAIRMAALMKIPMIFIATHDSVSVGEDGPTHQPIEHLESFRVMPNLNVFRPSNGLEVAWAWEQALHSELPSILVLSRQKIKRINSEEEIKSAYTIKKFHRKIHNISHNYTVKIIGTGSEVELAYETASLLMKKHENLNIDVISMISTNLFDKEERFEALECDLLVCIELSNSHIWYKYRQYAKDILVLGVQNFGFSGKAKDIMNHLGFTPENICKEISKKLSL